MKALEILKSELSAVVGDVAHPLRALLVALAGVLLASLWFDNRVKLVFGLTLGAIALGRVLDWLGRSQLPERPVRAVRLMELAIIAPGMFAAAAAGAIVVATVWLSVPESAPIEDKKLIGALATGITAFLSGAFVSWIGDKNDSRTAKRIRGHFQSKYRRFTSKALISPSLHYFSPDSAGERWVYSDDYLGVSGWGRAARSVRAQKIAAELEHGTSEPETDK